MLPVRFLCGWEAIWPAKFLVAYDVNRFEWMNDAEQAKTSEINDHESKNKS